MKSALRFKIAAMVVLGAMVLYWLSASLVAIIGGNSRAVSTFVEMLVVGGLAVVCWKWPLWGGIGMVLLGVVVAMYYMLVLYSLDEAWTLLFFICTPMAIAGLLLIESDWESKKPLHPS
jgi:hypothetical protein